jgi:hypothetical protein
MSVMTDPSKRPWSMAAGTVAVLMSLFALVHLHREDLFKNPPWQGLAVFMLPVALCALFSLSRSVRMTRLALCLGLLAAAVWSIGLPGVLATALTLLAALAVGSLLGRLGGLDAAGFLPALLRLTLGLAALSLVLTVLGHFPVAGRLSYALGLILLSLLGWRGIVREARAVWQAFAAPAGLKTWLGTGLFSGALLLVLCFSGLFGFTADTLAMHLYIPTYITTYGKWSYDFQSYLWALEPMASDLLFGVVYALSDALGAQLLNACGLILIAGLIYAACRRRLDSFDAALPAAAWLCVPYVLYLAGSLHAEVLLSLFLLAAFLHLEGQTESGGWQSGFVSGTLVSAALATKVLAVIMGPVLLVYVLLVPGRRRGTAWLLRFLAVAGLVVLLAGGFQYIYAYVETGNPVFFFYNHLFHSPYYPPTDFTDNHWTGHYDWHLPFDLTFDTQNFAETNFGSAGLQWYMLVPAALLCLWPKQGAEARWYAVAGLCFAALTLSSEQYFRYVLPALPFLALLTAELGLPSRRVLRGIYRGCMLAAVVLDLMAMQGTLQRVKDLPLYEVLHPAERAAVALQQVPEIAANRLIDSRETQPVNVLYVAHSWGAELRGTAYYQSWYNPELEKSFRYLRRAAGLQPLLDRYHIDYVVVNAEYRPAVGVTLVREYCRTHCQRLPTLDRIELYKVSR